MLTYFYFIRRLLVVKITSNRHFFRCSNSMMQLSVIPILLLILAASQISNTNARSIEAAESCNGNECPYGVERSLSSCICCMSCEQMQNRLPKPHIKCPTKIEDCGDCRHGYYSKPIYGQKSNYGICFKEKIVPTTTTTTVPVKLSTNLGAQHQTSGIPPWGVAVSIVLPLVAFSCVGLFLYKSVKAKKPNQPTPTPEIEIPLSTFNRTDAQIDDNDDTQARRTSSLKEPEESEESEVSASFVPLLNNGNSAFETETHRRAIPIDPPGQNRNETYQSPLNDLNGSLPSAPCLSALASTVSSTDSIHSNAEDEAADSGHQSSDYSSYNSGNYSSASTVPMDHLEPNIKAISTKDIKNDNGTIRFILHGEVVIT